MYLIFDIMNLMDILMRAKYKENNMDKMVKKVEELAKKFAERLAEEGYYPDIRPGYKLNMGPEALAITCKKNKDDRIAPTISITKDHVLAIENGRTTEEDYFVEGIEIFRNAFESEQYKNSSSVARAIEKFENRDDFLEGIAAFIYNHNVNKNPGFVHKKLNDELSVMVRYLVPEAEGSIPITKAQLEHIGVTEKELFETAIKNSPVINPPRIVSMNDILRQKGCWMPVDLRGLEKFLVINTVNCEQGAVAILYNGVADAIRERLGEDFFRVEFYSQYDNAVWQVQRASLNRPAGGVSAVVCPQR